MDILYWVIGVLGGATLLAFIIARMNAARAAATAPKLGPVTEVAGGALHWVEDGPENAEGPTLVCIHGLGSNLRAFTYALAPLLAKKHRVICVDRPGSGHSKRDGAHLAPLEEQGKMIFELLDKLGVEKPILIGHSLGGALSLRMAHDRPDRVSGLVLLAAATRPVEHVPDVFKGLLVRSGALRNFLGETFFGALAPLLGAKNAEIVFAPEPVVEGFEDRAGGVLGARPKGYIGASEDLVAAFEGSDWMREGSVKLKVPGVVLYGSDDALLCAADHGRGFAAEHGLKYIEMPGKGHMIPLTEPEACAEAVESLLEAVPA